MKYCPICGAVNNDEFAVCCHCGKSFEVKSGAYSTASAPVPTQFEPASDFAQDKKERCFEAVRKVFGSPIFLFAAIAFSLNIVMVLASYFEVFTMDIYPDAYAFETYDYIELITKMVFAFTAVIVVIPTFLKCVGLWLTYSAGRTKTGIAMSNVGLKLCKVAVTIQLVLIYILAALLVFVMILLAIIVIAASEEIFYDIPEELFGIMFIVLFLFAAVAIVLELVYMHKLRSLYSKLSHSFVEGVIFKGPSLYVIIGRFYLAATSLSSIIYLLFWDILYNGTYGALYGEYFSPAVISYSQGFYIVAVVSSVCCAVYHAFAAISYIRLRSAFGKISKEQ